MPRFPSLSTLHGIPPRVISDALVLEQYLVRGESVTEWHLDDPRHVRLARSVRPTKLYSTAFAR